jgi:hypothetical protein
VRLVPELHDGLGDGLDERRRAADIDERQLGRRRADFAEPPEDLPLAGKVFWSAVECTEPDRVVCTSRPSSPWSCPWPGR